MSKRKVRPPKGTPITADMSVRDMASALGTSTGWISQCKRMAAIPDDEFEKRLERAVTDPAAFTRRNYSVTAAILRGSPVPARGRVERAVAIYRRMTPLERAQFRAIIGRDDG